MLSPDSQTCIADRLNVLGARVGGGMPPRKGHTKAKNSYLGGNSCYSTDPCWRCDTENRVNLISAKFKTLGKRMLGKLLANS